MLQLRVVSFVKAWLVDAWAGLEAIGSSERARTQRVGSEHGTRPSNFN